MSMPALDEMIPHLDLDHCLVSPSAVIAKMLLPAVATEVELGHGHAALHRHLEQTGRLSSSCHSPRRVREGTCNFGSCMFLLASTLSSISLFQTALGVSSRRSWSH